MTTKAKRLTPRGVVKTLNMLLEIEPLALYRLANLRVACHALKSERPDLACHVSDLEFPVMGALELLNILITENSDSAIALKVDKAKRRLYFTCIPKAELKGGAVIDIPEGT